MACPGANPRTRGNGPITARKPAPGVRVPDPRSCGGWSGLGECFPKKPPCYFPSVQYLQRGTGSCGTGRGPASAPAFDTDFIGQGIGAGKIEEGGVLEPLRDLPVRLGSRLGSIWWMIRLIATCRSCACASSCLPHTAQRAAQCGMPSDYPAYSHPHACCGRAAGPLQSGQADNVEDVRQEDPGCFGACLPALRRGRT
jgi:hypothetical protein